MMPRDVAAASTQMTLQQLGLTKGDWRKLLEIPSDQLIAAQVAIAAKLGPVVDMASLRKGNGWRWNGGFAPVVDEPFCPTIPSSRFPTFSKNKPLMVGSNRDETNFIWFQAKMNNIFELTDYNTRKRPCIQQLGAEADTVLATYRKTRPEASAPDLYTAITTGAFFSARRHKDCGT